MSRQRRGGRRDEQVQNLPFLGRSWYKRGFSYWTRRTLLTVGFVFALAIMTIMTGGLVEGLATADMPVWVRALLLVVVAAAVVHSLFRAWKAFNIANRRARQRGVAMSMAEASGQPRRSGRERQRRGVAGSTGLGVLTALGGGALLVISVAFNIGWGVVAVIASCQKYFSPEEFAAWQKIERHRAAQDHPVDG